MYFSRIVFGGEPATGFAWIANSGVVPSPGELRDSISINQGEEDSLREEVGHGRINGDPQMQGDGGMDRSVDTAWRNLLRPI